MTITVTITPGPITHAHAKLINYKNAALLMLNAEGGNNIDIFDESIDSLCDGPCSACGSENDYFKRNLPQRNFTQRRRNCEKYKKLFLKLKECEEQCSQFKNQINFVRHHQLHQFNQIKSFENQLKTGSAESFCEPLMKIAHKLLIRTKQLLNS